MASKMLNINSSYEVDYSKEANIVLSRSTFNKLRYELLFIGLSVLLLVGISLLPKSPPAPVAPVAPVSTPSGVSS